MFDIDTTISETDGEDRALL